jgi:hypothetical protein
MMSEVALSTTVDTNALAALIDRAAATLSNAKTSAEVLDAKDVASLAYDAAKRAGRLAKAKAAHDDVLDAVHRAQADALRIEAMADQRLAAEYEAAQERGEVQKAGGDRRSINVPHENNDPPTVEQIGLTRKQVHEARQVRDAEIAVPGVVERTVEEAVANGEEPTRAKVRRAVREAISKAQETPKSEVEENTTLSDDAVNRRSAQERRQERRDETLSSSLYALQLAISPVTGVTLDEWRRAITDFDEFQRLITELQLIHDRLKNTATNSTDASENDEPSIPAFMVNAVEGNA